MASSTSRRQTSLASRVGATANEGAGSRPAKARPKNPTWLTVEDILEDLDIHRRTWQRWRTRNETPELHRLPNGELRIHRDAYKAWLDKRKVTS